MTKRELKPGFLLALVAALGLWTAGLAIGAAGSGPGAYREAANERLADALFVRIVVRNLVVSTALLSGTITSGVSTLLSIILNSVCSGRFVIPGIIPIDGGRALVVLTIVFEMSAYLIASAVGLLPVVHTVLSRCRPRVSFDHRKTTAILLSVVAMIVAGATVEALYFGIG